MTETTYAQAYTEVLEILKNLPEWEYNKIPRGKIEFYKNNCDPSYIFEVDKDLKNISKKANAIIISIYNDYFTTPKQKETLKNILADNEKKIEERKREKYNPDEIFKTNITNNEEIEEEKVDMQIVAYKQKSILRKIVDNIKKLLKKLQIK